MRSRNLISRPLTSIYFLDGLSALSMGTLLSLFAEELTQLAAWSLTSHFLLGLGLFLIPWSGFNFWSAYLKPTPSTVAALHFFVDGSWVLGSTLLLLIHSQSLNNWGWILLSGQGLFVTCVLLLKLRDFSRSRSLSAEPRAR